jgi:hypothetical protein
MRVLATQEFVEAAREAPQPLIQAVAELATGISTPTSLTQALTEAVGPAASDAPRAKRIGRDQIIGLTQDSERLKLWYYVSPTPFDAAPAPPFASMAKSELRALGVPNELIGPVQQIVMVEEIDHLAMAVDVKDRRIAFGSCFSSSPSAWWPVTTIWFARPTARTTCSTSCTAG